jgi:hypothetical protein
MRTPQSAVPANPTSQSNIMRSRSSGRLAALCGCLFAVALMAPAIALADTMSLSIAPEPVEELASQITYTATSEEGTFAVIAVNNPGVPCAADPAADDGHTITPGHLLESGSIGQFSGSINYTPPSTGTYTACGWLELPVGLLETDGGPVTAAASLPLDVRQPHTTLSLSFPRPPEPRKRFTLDVIATTEAQREIVVEGLPLTRRGCPVNYAAEDAQHLIDKELTGGPWRISTNINPLPTGTYIFCAWADPASDDGLYPEATTSLTLHLGEPSFKAKHRKQRRAHHRRPGASR